jgi:hypothetical protein
MATRLMEVTHRSLTNIAGRVRENVAIVVPLPALLAADGFSLEQILSQPQLPQPPPAPEEEQPHAEKLVWLEDEGLVPIPTPQPPSSSSTSLSYSAPAAGRWQQQGLTAGGGAGVDQVTQGVTQGGEYEESEEDVDLLQEVAETWGRWEQELLGPNVFGCGSTGQEYVSQYEQPGGGGHTGSSRSSNSSRVSSSAKRNPAARKGE